MFSSEILLQSSLVGCPFQGEVGFASLGLGIAGVIAFKPSLPFRFATLIPPSCFSLGAAGGHIYQMIAAHNFSPGNVGVVLPSNFLIPIVGFLLLWLSYKHPKPGPANRKSAKCVSAHGWRHFPVLSASKMALMSVGETTSSKISISSSSTSQLLQGTAFWR